MARPLPPPSNLDGQIFKNWTVIRYDCRRYCQYYYWCQCQCGRQASVSIYALKSDRATACRRCSQVSHGEHGNELYAIWHSMMDRCYNADNPRYSRYGGRGIIVCERWHDVRNFVSDLPDRPLGTGPTGKSLWSIDRIDVDGNYEADNVRWADNAVQARNKSNNIMITIDGRTQCLTDWACENGLEQSMVSRRIMRGWTPEKAVTTPVRKAKNNWKPT